MTAALFVAVFASAAVPAAHAAFPGESGPIVFTSNLSGETAVSRMDPDGGNVVRLTPDDGLTYDQPSVSGDGRTIALRGCSVPQVAGSCEIYVMDIDGDGLRPVTNSPLDAAEPAISPNGDRIAFTRTTAGDGSTDIYVVDSDGTNLQNLTGGDVEPLEDPFEPGSTAFTFESAPTFSPDGNRIAFVSDQPTDPEAFDFDTEIWIMDADGTGKLALTADAGFTFPPTFDEAPNFSPDGDRIAFSRLVGTGNYDIYTVSSDGDGSEAPAPLVTIAGNQERPTFSPDGTQIAFEQEAPGDRDIFVADVNFTTPATTATRLTNQGANTDPDWAVVPAAVQPPGPGPTPARPTYPGPPVGANPAAPFADCPAATAVVIRGTAANNSLVGTRFGDRIFAGTGNDTVDGLAGNDCIDLGPGTDRGQGGDGNDLIVGGLGADRMTGNLGNDRLRGGSSGDRLIGAFGNDTIHGQSGSDRVNGERGRDRINGGSASDVISAGSSGDRVAGDQGNDRINGNSGNDSIKGNSGRDRLKGSSGRDRLSGGSGNDSISARDDQRDRVNCGRGRDRVTADRVDRVARNCERVRRR